MTECVFCKIIKKELPADLVYEDREIIGVKSIKPEAPVHLLFIPKRHIEWEKEFNQDELTLFGKLVFAAKKIALKENIFKACKFILNIGKTGHISHIHLHLLGGWEKRIPMQNI